MGCRTQTCWSVDYLLQLFQVCSYSLQHRHRYSLGYLFSIFRKPLLFTIHGRISKWLQQTRVSNNAGPGAGPGRQPHNTPNQINYTQHFTLHYNHTFSWYKYWQSHHLISVCMLFMPNHNLKMSLLFAFYTFNKFYIHFVGGQKLVKM